MARHKNDYSVVVFFFGRNPARWLYVHDLRSFSVFLNTKHAGWRYMNVYDRRSNQYLCRFYPNSVFPRFL